MEAMLISMMSNKHIKSVQNKTTAYISR